MDDKEYYSLMNRSSSWALQQALKKKNTSSKNAVSKGEQKSLLPDNALTYASLELRQGSADTEMLNNLAHIIMNKFTPDTNTIADSILDELGGNQNNVVQGNRDEVLEQRIDIRKYDLIAWDFISKKEKD